MISSIILLILIHLKIVKPLVTELSYQVYMVICAIEVLIYFKVLFYFGDKYIKGDKRKMTVLEKIERCVSLVWDFQEMYGEEDVEDFCRKELHTYPQHNEIMEYFKHIVDLEKENAELKEKNRVLDCMLTGESLASNERMHQLDKAKQLLNFWLNDFYDNSSNPTKYEERHKILVESEQFLENESQSKWVNSVRTTNDNQIKLSEVGND